MDAMVASMLLSFAERKRQAENASQTQTPPPAQPESVPPPATISPLVVRTSPIKPASPLSSLPAPMVPQPALAPPLVPALLVAPIAARPSSPALKTPVAEKPEADPTLRERRSKASSSRLAGESGTEGRPPPLKRQKHLCTKGSSSPSSQPAGDKTTKPTPPATLQPAQKLAIPAAGVEDRPAGREKEAAVVAAETDTVTATPAKLPISLQGPSVDDPDSPLLERRESISPLAEAIYCSHHVKKLERQLEVSLRAQREAEAEALNYRRRVEELELRAATPLTSMPTLEWAKSMERQLTITVKQMKEMAAKLDRVATVMLPLGVDEEATRWDKVKVQLVENCLTEASRRGWLRERVLNDSFFRSLVPQRLETVRAHIYEESERTHRLFYGDSPRNPRAPQDPSSSRAPPSQPASRTSADVPASRAPAGQPAPHAPSNRSAPRK